MALPVEIEDAGDELGVGDRRAAGEQLLEIASLKIPISRWRVVCGLSETIASFSPRYRFIKVDLPALGRPTSATVPAWSLGSVGIQLPAWPWPHSQ